MTLAAKPPVERSTERVYERLRQMAIDFEFRPGERLNELDLARRFNVSRTPLRQAFNRLASEGFLKVANRGFFCRSLEVKEICDLYELRCETEVIGIRLACQRASDADIERFAEFSLREGKKHEGMSARDMVRVDELFHEGLARLSGNAELLRLIENIDARIRFVRCFDMQHRVGTVNCEHEKISDLLRKRDQDGCEALMRAHITRRQEQIVTVVKEAFAHIYVGAQDDALST